MSDTGWGGLACQVPSRSWQDDDAACGGTVLVQYSITRTGRKKTRGSKTGTEVGKSEVGGLESVE